MIEAILRPVARMGNRKEGPTFQGFRDSNVLGSGGAFGRTCPMGIPIKSRRRLLFDQFRFEVGIGLIARGIENRNGGRLNPFNRSTIAGKIIPVANGSKGSTAIRPQSMAVRVIGSDSRFPPFFMDLGPASRGEQPMDSPDRLTKKRIFFPDRENRASAFPRNDARRSPIDSKVL